MKRYNISEDTALEAPDGEWVPYYDDVLKLEQERDALKAEINLLRNENSKRGIHRPHQDAGGVSCK